jgi:probable HAF family extracellular repeat protein
MADLGTLGGGGSSAWDVNGTGQVAGWSSTAAGRDHAFLYDDTLHDLGTLGGTDSFGLAISGSGQVVGHSHTPGDGATHAFLWTPTAPNGASGSMIDLGTLGGTGSFARDVNANGQVVGQSFIADNFERHAFLYSADSGMVDLNLLIDPLSGWTLTFATAINDAGQIAGFGVMGEQEHAFLLTPVPEPATLLLLAVGLPLLGWGTWRRSGRGDANHCLLGTLVVRAPFSPAHIRDRRPPELCRT